MNDQPRHSLFDVPRVSSSRPAPSLFDMPQPGPRAAAPLPVPRPTPPPAPAPAPLQIQPAPIQAEPPPPAHPAAQAHTQTPEPPRPAPLPVVDDPDVYLSAAKLLEDNNHLLLAGALLAEAERQFPDHAPILLRYSYFIGKNRGGNEAKERWRLMQALAPHHVDGFVHYARHLSEEGRDEEADVVLGQAAERFPGNKTLLATRAFNAGKSGDIRGAIRRREIAIEHFPQWEEAISHHNALVALLTTQSPDEALEHGSQQLSDKPSHGFRQVREDAEELRQVFLRFESIGMTCEFGLVQRLFGLEPLGLLRFASIAPHNLVRILNSDFAEIADAPDALFIKKPRNYWLRIPSVGIQMPTMFEPPDADAFMVQMRRRLRFLSTKLLEDLREAEKIFIYKTPHSMLSVIYINEIVAAVRRHGPGHVLFVRQPNAQHPAGSVEERPDGVYIGRLPEQPQGVAKLDIDAWGSVCKQVLAAVEARLRSKRPGVTHSRATPFGGV